MRWTAQTLTGWGRSIHSLAQVSYPTDSTEVLQSFEDNLRPLIARGNGRSYGDTALNANGYVICTSNVKQIDSFDPATGEIVVGAGITFGDLMERFAAQGWIAPVTPGTQFATIAGAIANDVHGKNHELDGSFGDHVLWIELILPNGTIQRVDPDSSPELFAATIGGIGLTGVITRVCFRMKRIPSQFVHVRERRVRDLDEYLDLLEEVRHRCHYSVGWIDGLAQGRSLGRGVLETAEHVEDTRTPKPPRRLRLTFDLPSRSINSVTARVFNALYYRRIPPNGRERRLDLRRFFYPLDSILEWNRLYGRAGFVQFQCVIPDDLARTALRLLLTRITQSGNASFLAVIKTLGRDGRGYLSFPTKGVTLALDFPRRAAIPALLDSLHDITLDHGGRVYLAKDSCLRPEQFRRMYPNLSKFQSVLRSIDPERRMRSDMALRLQL